MMELTACAFILILISLVTATPYGYGVKGGAGTSSKAESSAVAGSFGNQGEIPVGVPFGSAFSGSFSKSSSSSASSSSASSSSSSGSFSYNGSGGGSFSSPDTKGNAGCTSGICQNTGHQGSSADFNGYDIANSAAVAGSGGTTRVSCQGSQCNGSSDKCLSGQCQSTEPSITGYDSGNKCSSGKCGPTSPSGYSASQFDESDDIHFVPHSSKSIHDSKNYSFNDKTAGYSAGSNCQHGNCGPSAISTQPTVAHGSSNSYPANSNSEVRPGYNLPVTHLETPNANSGCNPGICQTGHDSSPTSYSVPIHGSSSGCNAPGCSRDFSSPGVNPQIQYDGKKDDASEKKLPMYTGGFGGPAGMLKPNEFNIPISTISSPVHLANPMYNTPSILLPGCQTSNCIGSPTIAVSGTSTTAQSGSYSGSVTASNNKPIYTGGFGGPPGMLKPDEYDIKVPVHSSTPSYSNHSPRPSAVCATPNCEGYATKPISESSSELPVYTGGFGGPPGVLNPNVVNVPYSTPNTNTFGVGDTTPQASFGVPKPVTVPNLDSGSTNNYRPIGVTYPGAPAVAPIIPSYPITQPLHSTGISTPECKTGNCAAYPGSVPVVTAPSGSYGNFEGCKAENCASYPVTAVNVNTPTGTHGNSEICKTGHCAGLPTSGYYDKSEADTNSSSGLYGHPTGCKTGNCAVPNAVPSRPHGVAYPNNNLKPSIPEYTAVSGGPSDTNVPSGSGSIKCKTSNCADSLSANSGVNAQSGFDFKSKEQLPVYTGGFGGPSGLLKPNDYSKPDVTAIPNKPVPGLTIPVTCSSGNCNPKEVLSSSSGHNIGLNGAHAISSSSAHAVAYSGGFGGPPGFLTPYDNGKLDLTKVTDGQNQGTHYSGGNALDTNSARLTGTWSNTGSQGGSVVGTTVVSGSTANANTGTFDYNTQGNGVKGGSPCGEGCVGSHQNNLQSSGSYSAAGARSLSSSDALGVGGSFASSSASAHSSAAAYRKGGYGKR
ncbi:unnamed protein product [Arctia plantaginis]|uniref:Uncharacterized protein n=1 Tax=Arctia plantaginis TaxID=874455 RepID=A0A8S1A5X9_ARCPL|nr:unnamed protein product [Arctia plantaginis]